MTTTTTTACATTPDVRVTRSLLGYGVIAGPFYVVVSLTQALTRPGFDLTRHEWSLLSNGDLGWIQIANFVLTGLMVLAAAVGLRRALQPGTGSVWGPRLLATYGVSLIAAGILRADPSLGFPVGTPDVRGSVSWHGLGHLVAGSIGFAAVIAACFVLARRFTGGLARLSRVTGVVFLVGFAGIATGAGNPVIILAFTAAVCLVWAWLAAVCVRLYRTAI
jgi:uncharacterized protein DUF998